MCEDWPACGHEQGCCPDFNDEGRQTNMVCVCGAKVPISNRYSLCDSCMRRDAEEEANDGYPGSAFFDEEYDDGEEDEREP
jgi:hypothetical protein